MMCLTIAVDSPPFITLVEGELIALTVQRQLIKTKWRKRERKGDREKEREIDEQGEGGKKREGNRN